MSEWHVLKEFNNETIIIPNNCNLLLLDRLKRNPIVVDQFGNNVIPFENMIRQLRPMVGKSKEYHKSMLGHGINH